LNVGGPRKIRPSNIIVDALQETLPHWSTTT